MNYFLTCGEMDGGWERGEWGERERERERSAESQNIWLYLRGNEFSPTYCDPWFYKTSIFSLFVFQRISSYLCLYPFLSHLMPGHDLLCYFKRPNSQVKSVELIYCLNVLLMFQQDINLSHFIILVLPLKVHNLMACNYHRHYQSEVRHLQWTQNKLTPFLLVSCKQQWNARSLLFCLCSQAGMRNSKNFHWTYSYLLTV